LAAAAKIVELHSPHLLTDVRYGRGKGKGKIAAVERGNSEMSNSRGAIKSLPSKKSWIALDITIKKNESYLSE
jgi:hypothetical protein